MHALRDSLVVVTRRCPEAHLGLSEWTVVPPRRFVAICRARGPGVPYGLRDVAYFARFEHTAEKAFIDRIVWLACHPDKALWRSDLISIHRDVQAVSQSMVEFERLSYGATSRFDAVGTSSNVVLGFVQLLQLRLLFDL